MGTTVNYYKHSSEHTPFDVLLYDYALANKEAWGVGSEGMLQSDGLRTRSLEHAATDSRWISCAKILREYCTNCANN